MSTWGRPKSSEYTHFKSSTTGVASNPRGRKLALAAGIGLPTTVVLYALVHLDTAPYTKRKRVIDLSKEAERRLGAEQFQQFLRANRNAVCAPNDPRTMLVANIGRRISQAADPGQRWDFTVIDSNEVNAFVLPGGHVVVYTGCVPGLVRSRD